MKETLLMIDNIEECCYQDREDGLIQKIQSVLATIASQLGNNLVFLELIKKIFTAMENSDYVLIADYLEFGVKKLIMKKDIPQVVFEPFELSVQGNNEECFFTNTLEDELSLYVLNSMGKYVRLNSQFSPKHEAGIVFEGLGLKKNNTSAICLFGISTGIIAEKILEFVDDKTKLIIYEPSDVIIKYCLESINNSESSECEKKIAERIKKILNDDRVELFCVKEKNETFNRFLGERLDYRDLARLKIMVNPGYKFLYPKESLVFVREIESYRRITVTNKCTTEFSQKRWLEQLFKNFSMLKNINLASELEKVVPDEIPSVIVAAGPSLEKNAEFLKQAKGHFFIIAVDTALKALLDRGIIPDITITVDPRKNPDYYNNEKAYDIPCIFAIDSNPEIVKAHRGRRFLLCSNKYLYGLFDRIGKKYVVDQCGGGSVATVAFALLYNMNQKKIIFVGQDLASSNGKTHAGGVSEGELGEMTVEGIDGNNVTTRQDWYNYLKWYEDAIENIRKAGQDTVIIDATEGGAKIHGTEIMTLEETINSCKDEFGNLPDFDFETNMEKLKYFLNDNEYEQLCDNHKRNVSKLKELRIDAEEVIRICKYLIEGIENKTISESNINKNKKIINAKHKAYLDNPMHCLINQYVSSQALDTVVALSFEGEDTIQQEISGIKLIQVSFEKIIEAIEIICEDAMEYDYLLK